MRALTSLPLAIALALLFVGAASRAQPREPGGVSGRANDTSARDGRDAGTSRARDAGPRDASDELDGGAPEGGGAPSTGLGDGLPEVGAGPVDADAGPSDAGPEDTRAGHREGDAAPPTAPSAEPDPRPPPLHEPGPTTLPAVEPDPAVAPVLEGRQRDLPPEATTIATRDRPETVLRVLVGLLALMAIAYLGGHERVLAWERRLGISQVITAGLPFILLGMIARLPSVGILTDAVLTELSPLLTIGLGSVGFIAGFRLDTKRFQGLPRGTSSTALLSTLIPSATVAAAMAPLLLVFSGETWSRNLLRNPVFLRDALILATAGAMTARSAIRLRESDAAERAPEPTTEGTAAQIVRLEELAGVAGLAFVAAFFRQQHGHENAWHLPGMAWLLLTLGLGAALGLLFYTMLVVTPRGADFLVVALGAIAFAAGAANYLRLSSVAVPFVAGVILVNFPGTFQPRLREMLGRLERPIYLLALFVIGALWRVGDWRGWVLMPVFMLSRLAGKQLAAALAARSEHLPITAEESRTLAISPIGALAIAIVVNAQLLYPGGSISLVVSAVIGGGVLTEAFVQLASRRGATQKSPASLGPPPSRSAEGPAPVEASSGSTERTP
jgi:hypothetical protein